MNLLIIGLMLIAIGMVILLLPWRRPRDDRFEENVVREASEGRRIWNESKTGSRLKGGAVIMIGPLPIVLVSDPRMAVIMMLLALGIMLVWSTIYKFF